MKDTLVPRPATVLSDLSGPLAAIHGSLEGAAFSAHEAFAAKGREVEPYYHAATFRYEAKLLLEAEGFAMQDLGNNGLMLTIARYTIKILKADQGRIPCPGTSHTKREFYYQTGLEMWPDAVVSILREPPINLIIVWDVTAKYALAPLELVCPKSGDADRSSAESYWRIPIPHPATSIVPILPVVAECNELDDDLPITLRGAAKEQNGPQA
jgi:hypothetical protein